MNLCSDKHDEVAYEGRRCPVCILIEEHRDEVRELDVKVDALKAEVEVLEQINNDLTAEAVELRGQVRDLELVLKPIHHP